MRGWVKIGLGVRFEAITDVYVYHASKIKVVWSYETFEKNFGIKPGIKTNFRERFKNIWHCTFPLQI